MAVGISACLAQATLCAPVDFVSYERVPCLLCVFFVFCSDAGAWPREGAWAATDGGSSPYIFSCPPPAERCLGWNITLGASQCGTGYLQGSFACSACSRGYYQDDAGACSACPYLGTAWQRYGQLLYVCAAIIGIVVFVYALLALMVCVVGGTIAGGLFRMSNLAMWALMCAQVT